MNNFNPDASKIPPIYGASALYTEQPQGDDARDGVIPLDTLPAQWWNWLWNNITNYCNSIVQPELMNIFAELSNVLAAENITPDDVTPNQLATAVIKIHERIATAQTAGSVKSSDDKGKVSVNSSTGVMTANGLGDIDNLTTTIKTSVVAAVNELKSTIDTFIAGAVTGVKGHEESSFRTGQVDLTPANIGAQPAGDYKKTQAAVTDPTADGTTLTAIATISQDTNGVISATKKTIQDASDTQKGVVQLSNSYDGTSTETAVTEKALSDGLATKQDTGDYKKTQEAVTDPTADGNSTTFIDSISQDTNGVITATKKNVSFPVTSVNGQSGDVSLTASDVGAKPTQEFVPDPTWDGKTVSPTFIYGVNQDTNGVITAYKAVVPVISVNGQTGGVRLTASDVGAKPTQTAKTDPAADGNSTTFIDSISQDTNGVISATKKNVSFPVTSVNGQSGDVSLTASDVGAQSAGNYKTTQEAVTDPTAVGNSTTFIDSISQNTNGVISATKKNVSFPVTSVNGKTDAVSLTASDVGAKPTQGAVADPTVDGSGIAFIDSISQDTNGVITPHKKNVQSASTSQSGIVQLSNSYDGISETKAVTEKALSDSITLMSNSSNKLYRLYKSNTASYREHVTFQYTGHSLLQYFNKYCGVLSMLHLQIQVSWSGNTSVNETPLMDLLIGTGSTDAGLVIYVYPAANISENRVLRFTFQHEYTPTSSINRITLRLYDMANGETLLYQFSENYSTSITSTTTMWDITQGVNVCLNRNNIAPVIL